ncbi:unnamed protein product [Amoebophrya sp. A25]|nr:unnamed protein product [Amoebophrya sp. A25]|eukprot:GSA25T00016778001.1
MLASERSARRVIKQNATQKRVMDRLEYKDAVRGEYGRRPVFQRSLHNQQVRAGFGNQVRTMMQRFKKRLFKKQGSRGNHAYGYGTSSLLPPSVYKDLRSTHRVARVNLYCLSWVMAFGCCCFTPLICLSSYCVLTVREKVGSLELIKTKAYVVMMISVLSLLAMLCAGLPISIIVFVAAGDGYDNKSFVSAWVSDSLSECTPFTYDKDQRGKPPEFDDDGVITNGGDPNNCHYTRKCCAQERTEVSCYQQSKDRAVCLRSAVTSIDNKRHHELSLPSYQKNIKARAGLLLDASIKYVTQAQFDSDGGLTEVSRGHCFRTLD